MSGVRGIATPVALLTALALAAAAAPAGAQDDLGGGAQVGGVVPSTLALSLSPTAAGVEATVTTTDPGSSLSVAGEGASATLDAAPAAGPFRAIDPTFGLVLQQWDEVLASRPTAIRLRSRRAAPAVVYVTLSSATP